MDLDENYVLLHSIFQNSVENSQNDLRVILNEGEVSKHFFS